MDFEHVLYRRQSYYIEITSWENDGDNYKTVTFPNDNSDMNEKELNILLDFIKLFQSRQQLSNIYNPNHAEIENIESILIKFDNDHNNYSTYNDNESILDFYYELMSELELSSEEFFARVVDKCNVYYFNEPVYAYKKVII